MIKHGTNRGWLAGCRNRCCERAHQNYMNTRHRMGIHDPRYECTSTEETILHLKMLQDVGVTFRIVSDLTGIENKTIRRYTSGDCKRITRINANKILSVPLNAIQKKTLDLPDGRLVPVTGSRRRIQAMSWLGWSMEEQNQMAGGYHDHSALQRLLYFQESTFVSKHNNISAAFDNAMLLPRPEGWNAQRVRNLARKKGWYGPGAWTHIDDPHCVPENGRLKRDKSS